MIQNINSKHVLCILLIPLSLSFFASMPIKQERCGWEGGKGIDEERVFCWMLFDKGMSREKFRSLLLFLAEAIASR